ncbi:CGNR zinc finger domain-containing protein [Streptomyces sp. NPDC089919]|uniref:CGNR zinc finger domain-containing protein n=1 Tax=Streptomyces sp. NPDC089919 TaxID=3155188 RepID=UPI0034393E2B
MKEAVTAPATPPPPPAPGADRYLALDFANSLLTNPGGEVDLLGTPESASRWLAERELAPADGRLYEPCTDRLRALRGPVRALLAARVDALVPPWQALAAVNAALTEAPSAALLGWDEERGLHRTPAHPSEEILAHALAVLAADAADLLTGPDAELLAACGSPPCTRFLLRTHGARHWCSTRCGDRVRAARAYAKRTQAKAAAKSAQHP